MPDPNTGPGLRAVLDILTNWIVQVEFASLTKIITANAVNCLVTDPRRNGVSSLFGTECSRLASP